MSCFHSLEQFGPSFIVFFKTEVFRIYAYCNKRRGNIFRNIHTHDMLKSNSKNVLLTLGTKDKAGILDKAPHA